MLLPFGILLSLYHTPFLKGATQVYTDFAKKVRIFIWPRQSNFCSYTQWFNANKWPLNSSKWNTPYSFPPIKKTMFLDLLNQRIENVPIKRFYDTEVLIVLVETSNRKYLLKSFKMYVFHS